MKIIDHFRNERFFSSSIRELLLLLVCRREFLISKIIYIQILLFLDFHFFSFFFSFFSLLFFASNRIVSMISSEDTVKISNDIEMIWSDIVCVRGMNFLSRALISRFYHLVFLSLSRFFFISLLIHHWRWSSSSFPFIVLVVFLRVFLPPSPHLQFPIEKNKKKSI